MKVSKVFAMDECTVVVSGALILTAGKSGEEARNMFKFSSSHLIFYRTERAFWKLNKSLLHDLAYSMQEEKCVGERT